MSKKVAILVIAIKGFKTFFKKPYKLFHINLSNYPPHCQSADLKLSWLLKITL